MILSQGCHGQIRIKMCLKAEFFLIHHLEDVKAFLKDCSNVRCYQGFFPATTGPIGNVNFCFVHVDVDIYKSVMDSCAFFYPRMLKGGIMLFDDYDCPNCPSAKMAVDEFFKDKVKYPCYLLTEQCYVIKL